MPLIRLSYAVPRARNMTVSMKACAGKIATHVMLLLYLKIC